MKKKLLSVLMALTMLAGTAVYTPAADVPFSVNAEAASSEKLAKPTSLKATINGTKVTLSWKKVSGAEAYGVYKYNTSKEKYVKVKTTTKTKITIDLKKAGTYKFRVYSLDKVDGKYKKGKYAYKKVTIQDNVLEDVIKGFSYGTSRSKVLDRIGDGKYTAVDDLILWEKEEGVIYCYQFENKKLKYYGVAYEYSDSALKKLKKLFSGSEWNCLNEDPTEFTKEDFVYDTLIYFTDDEIAVIMHEQTTDLIIALVGEL